MIPHPPFLAAYAHAHRSTVEETARDFRPGHYLRWLNAQRSVFTATLEGEVPETDAPFECWLAAQYPASLVTT